MDNTKTYFKDIKAVILYRDNTQTSYAVQPTTNLQPIINMLKNRNNKIIDSVWLQHELNAPMEEVTAKYDIL